MRLIIIATPRGLFRECNELIYDHLAQILPHACCVNYLELQKVFRMKNMYLPPFWGRYCVVANTAHSPLVVSDTLAKCRHFHFFL